MNDTGTVAWLLDGRPDLAVVWEYDQPLGGNRFDRVAQAVHDAQLDLVIANLHDGCVIVTSKREVTPDLVRTVNSIVIDALLHRDREVRVTTPLSPVNRHQ